MHNLQGDIIAIVDGNGNKVVEYKYDAWGKPLSKTGSMASTLGTLNPFRYRGYVYDEETGLYYLYSRFYHPSIGRFCNADRRVEKNLFTYCNNRPTNKIDSNGCSEEDIPDYTIVLNNELEKQILSEFGPRRIGDGTDNSPSFVVSNFSAFWWFANTMLDEGPISYKTDSIWNSAFPTLPTADKVSTFRFRGRKTTREDFGNIAFGYLGSAMGISREYLLLGAGVYKKAKRIAAKSNRSWQQALSADPLTFIDNVLEAVLYDPDGYWGNDANDYDAILFGIDQYYVDTKSN